MKLRLIHQLIYLIITVFVFSGPASLVLAQGHAPWVGDAFSGMQCAGKGQGYGPFDYTLRAQYASNLALVEGAHFTPDVENLIRGRRGDDPYGDLDYTLRAWPNHHRALNSIMRYMLRNKDSPKIRTYTPVECYLQRAINYSPNDGVARMLYGMFQSRTGRLEEALSSYQEAERLAPTNLQIKYNMGLLLVKLEQYQQAQAYAREVYSRDFPLPGLMRQLKEKGYWEESNP